MLLSSVLLFANIKRNHRSSRLYDINRPLIRKAFYNLNDISDQLDDRYYLNDDDLGVDVQSLKATIGEITDELRFSKRIKSTEPTEYEYVTHGNGTNELVQVEKFTFKINLSDFNAAMIKGSSVSAKQVISATNSNAVDENFVIMPELLKEINQGAIVNVTASTSVKKILVDRDYFDSMVYGNNSRSDAGNQPSIVSNDDKSSRLSSPEIDDLSHRKLLLKSYFEKSNKPAGGVTSFEERLGIAGGSLTFDDDDDDDDDGADDYDDDDELLNFIDDDLPSANTSTAIATTNTEKSKRVWTSFFKYAFLHVDIAENAVSFVCVWLTTFAYGCMEKLGQLFIEKINAYLVRNKILTYPIVASFMMMLLLREWISEFKLNYERF